MTTDDITQIAQLCQAWGLYRDQGRWDELAQTFTADGTITVTWFDGRFADFIAASQAQHQPRSPRVKHQIALPVVAVRGNRAVSEGNVQIMGRFAAAPGVVVDYTSHARFLDRLERDRDGWRIARRIAIYEKDRLDAVTPGPAFDAFMRETDFSAVPEPYRYLGHRLLTSGRSLHDGIPCDGTPEAARALAEAQDWLVRGA